MAPPPDDDHECGWKVFAKDLVEKMAELEAKMAAMERRVLGPKSENLPPMDREVRKQRPADPAATQEKRRRNAELRATRVETETVEHKVPDADRTCPKCSGTKLRPVGIGKESIVVDYVPGYFRRRRHVRETLACLCGQHMVVAPGPDHSIEGARYGDGFRAFVVTSKCADSIPLYRQARQLSRLGIPISRSTLTDLLHQTARSVGPLAERLLELIAEAEVVQADETSLKMQKPNKRGFVWTFLAGKLIAYRFASNRSGATPEAVLGSGAGTLVVDMYTGYNVVTGTGKRDRAGCLAHVRRRFFDALPYAPEGKVALEMIRDVYVVEHDAIAAGVAGTDEHRRMRQARTGPILARFMTWLEAEKHLHPPKGPMGSAVAYALNNWTELTRFIENPGIPPDNNRSESALRVCPRPEELSLRWPRTSRPEPRRPLFPRRNVHGQRQGPSRLSDRHPRPPWLAPCRQARRAPPPELVAASLTAVSPSATVTPAARAPNTSRVGRLRADAYRNARDVLRVWRGPWWNPFRKSRGPRDVLMVVRYEDGRAFERTLDLDRPKGWGP